MLGSLTNLTTLGIYDRIANLDVLSNLPNLETLILGNEFFPGDSGVSVLYQLPELNVIWPE